MPAPETAIPAAPGPGSASPDHAWIRRFEPAQAGAAGGPLSGLRFAVKDNIDVAGQPTTAACPDFAYTPAVHAAVVERLLRAGAALAGKTNLDQFACGLNGTRSPYGAVPNAYDPAYVSGGSSSGSAYVVAAGEMDFALGTDTAGSGRVPAGLNNIVGLKPSRGLIPAHGVFPAARSVDCVSILARTVATAVQVLEAAAGPDPRDPYSRVLAMKTTPLPPRPRVGVPAQLEFFGDTLSEQAWQDAMRQVQDLGGTLVPIDYAPLAEAAAMLYDSALVAERYEAVREFFDAHADSVIQPVRDIIAAGRGYDAADLYRAQHRLQALARQADAMWADIDLLCVPTAPTHCAIAAMLADPVARNRELGYYTNFVNLLDYAALAIPTGLRTDGLPFGVTLIGPAGSDWQLADVGQRLHHATGLPQGATALPLPAPQPIAALQPTPATHLHIAVVGAHLTGMPLNGQLIERGATLAETTRTAPHYRLYALRGTVPPKPGLRRVAGEGVAIDVEVWNVPLPAVGSFLALIPSPLGLGSLELADGRWVHGFICEDHAYGDAQDVSAYGGWRAYVASRAQPPA
ncbi:allophanate hydrolase [Bordetella genomosp. 9]|uniref:Allophanate hydrolase n=1 Tax=Bordetella genomosp. 9 TaxID=1416803 RepID=A0A261RNM4_9BORD|nr:allophanate hydrolase [Bordetella genomosp. 9]OZI26377.1 allophanate hydrolase [Bordetella genomosp. 9]